MIDLDKMEALARAATPGPWELNRHGAVIGGPVQQYANGKSQNQLAMATVADWMRLDEMACNAAHIAATNPAAVLELIALARQAGGAETVAIPLVSGEELLEQAAQACDQQADGINGPYRSACLQCANAVRELRDATVNAEAATPTSQETPP